LGARVDHANRIPFDRAARDESKCNERIQLPHRRAAMKKLREIMREGFLFAVR